MTKTINIAVSGLNATDNPGPGIAVARAIKDDPTLNVRMIGLSYDAMEPGIYMHHVIDKSYQIPLPSAGKDALLERLRVIHSKEPLDLIIPNFDAELYNFIQLGETLRSFGIRTFLPSVLQLEKVSKHRLPELGKAQHCLVPESKPVSTIEEASKLIGEYEFPLVVKGKFYEAYVAYTSEQVHSYFHKINAKWGLPVIIQKFIQGKEYNVAALGDGLGGMIGAVPMRKLVLTDKGKGWAGVAIEAPEMIELAKTIIASLKWKGGLELEIMKTDHDELYLLEINPRFPAWIYFSAGAGQNLPAALVHMSLGEKIEPFQNYEIGKMFVRYSWDHITDIKEFERISTIGEL
jgi:carbamoyl-phosphate synthase large subunit